MSWMIRGLFGVGLPVASESSCSFSLWSTVDRAFPLPAPALLLLEPLGRPRFLIGPDLELD